MFLSDAENGPFRIKDDLTLVANEYGWDQTHNMIFVDQVITRLSSACLACSHHRWSDFVCIFFHALKVP